MFSKFSVRARLALGFSAILAMVLCLSTLSIVRMSSIGHQTDYVLKEKLHNERLIAEWKNIIEANVPRTVAAGKTEDSETEKRFQDDIAKASERATTILDELKNRITDPQAKELLRQAMDIRSPYQATRKEAFALKKTDMGRARQFFDGEFKRRADDYVEAANKLLRRQHALINAVGDEIHDENNTTIRATVLIAACALLGSAGLAVVIGSSITRTLGGEPADAVAVAQEIARGNLLVEIPVRARDTGSLLHAMEVMRDSLAQIVQQVRGGTETIMSASGEIAAGNQDLSIRTEQQAGAIAEAVSSMDELTSTVNQNAAHAKRANELAQNASQVARKGGNVVSDVMATMGVINESSKRIADIISVIDGIAFQTNILALNAAVEAARAGEQGRGFAVVASEVRNLAQRSAQAAREIKELISSSVERVASGTELVNEAGRTMSEVVESVVFVSSIIGEIANASAEQTISLAQVNRTMVQMESTTQQNASLVEESALAARAMNEQAIELAAEVRQFQIGTDHNPRSIRPPLRHLGLGAVSVGH